MSLEEFFKKASEEKKIFNSKVDKQKEIYESKIDNLKFLITLDSIKQKTLKDNIIADLIAEKNNLDKEKIKFLDYNLNELRVWVQDETLYVGYDNKRIVIFEGNKVGSFYKELCARVLERIPILQDNLPF
ncbi:hypothetical protein KAI04_02430 [Candidatus Pacearchaeota archaeon]|nr:hypothetical protein [Candidatus Pacearchaeota archaeon]